MASGGETPRRASVLEIVGAWLHLWTPPRDAVVPPVPWRKLALWGGAAVVALGVVLALAIPRIDAANDRRAAQKAAGERHDRLVQRDRTIAAQRPRHGALAAGPRDRARLIGAVEASILADARARARTGEIRPVQGPSACERSPGSAAGRYGVLDCFVVTRRFKATSRNAAGEAGYPFRAVVDFKRFTYTWCRTVPIPGELSIPDPATVVRLPPECRPPDQR